MGVNVREMKDGHAVLELDGHADFENVPALRKAVFRIVSRPELKEIDVDLCSVETIDTAGIAMMVELVQILSGRNGKLKLVGVPESVRKVVHLSRLEQLFELPETDENSVACKALT